MDRVILELIFTDAFCDMFFYEGDESIEKAEKYLRSLEAGENTEEQDNKFFEEVIPYIDNSVMIYSKYNLVESQESKIVGADTFNKTTVPADVLNQTNVSARNEAKKKFFSSAPKSKKITEIDENVFGQIIFETLKNSVDLAKAKVYKVGKPLSDATTVGIAAASRKIPEDVVKDTDEESKVALAAPDTKNKRRG